MSFGSRLQVSFSKYFTDKKIVFNRYGLPFAVTLLACYLVFHIRQSESVQVSSIIMASTIFAAVHGGFGPAILNSIIGTAFIETWLVGSPDAWPSTLAEFLRLGTYLSVSLGVSFLVSLLRSTLCMSEELRTRAEVVNREKDAILSVVAHDLKNPIGSAIGFVEVLRDPSATELPPAQREKFLANIHRACRISLEIIHNLQQFASLGTYRQILKFETIDVVAELTQIVASMEIRAQEKQIQMRTSFPREPIYVHSDVILLNRAVQNIVENALKYSPFGSVVNVSCRSGQGSETVEIEVEDDGPGIPLSEQERIFEPFYTTSNRPTGGEASTGLGLPSLKSIADMLGMTVRVRSDVGQGSAFTLSLPLDEKRKLAPAKRSEANLADVQLGPL